MPEPIILYDISWKVKGKSWSPNTWKPRYCLNIKGIPYQTVWVEFPDIAALCTKIGAPPSATARDGKPVYTLPVIYDPNTQTTVSESTKIAEYLDEAYPRTVALVPRGPQVEEFQRASEKLLFGIDVLSIMVPGVYMSLNEASQPYFRATREKRFGKLEELSPAGSEKRAQHWEGVKNTFHRLGEMLQGNAEQEKLLFLGGNDVSYQDIRIASILMWIKAIFGEDSKEWQDVVSWDGGKWARFTDVFRKYEAVDSGSLAKL
ncbi:hypothetical protein L226DRAFT_504158 [Lentinus tigrinus ALCF2SS1-7]|uniref:GST N-terminal domain-containing protein n=1 Tax=Lentinus tigrinus ALCF2SS1-6 TaxID=1328759 RepID=A0A5C2SGV5_9APHY|nr:hypothetical protein L227DRAFT_573676 [Lentinus tigrinus ALCF2SS1-6]RPD77737.1 hypothetical protein L226DRAFT_504158 [Lentinus tigrinus ALCF2SS1-7]